MKGWSGERTAFVAVLVAYVTVLLGVLGLILGWWSGGSDKSAQLSSESALDAGPGVDGPTTAPTGSLFLITNTPTPSPSPTSTPVPPTRTPEPTSTPEPKPESQQQLSATPEHIDFSGRWRVTDTVTDGTNTGNHYSFDVFLAQDGNRLSGGNGNIKLTGTITGDTATIAYVQPALGYEGTFVWKLVDADRAEGLFTSSAPNSGASVLKRPG